MHDTSNAPSLIAPNHHAHYRGLSGVMGWLAARSMSTGRTEDAELALGLTGLRRGDRVVDIGCGPGVAARLAAQRGAIVTGIDPAAVMLRAARRADRADAVTWRTGGAEALPIADRSQDIAWSLASVHHWPDLEGGLAEVVRVLAPGGRFLAGERRVAPGATGLASHGWTDSQADRFAELCEGAGLRSIEVACHATSRGSRLTVLSHVDA